MNKQTEVIGIQTISNLISFSEEESCLREKIEKMDEYFMHLQEHYPEIRAANRLKVILRVFFIIKAGFYSYLKLIRNLKLARKLEQIQK